MAAQPYTEHEKYANSADDYLDQHNVYELFGSLLKKLVIHKPRDPLSFMISSLEQPVQQLRVVVVSPPGARVSSLLSRVVRDLGVLRVRLASVLAEEVSAATPLGKQAKTYLEQGGANEVPEGIVMPLLAARTNKADALQSGWILEGYPNTRSQALAMQTAGILPTHVLYFTNGPTDAADAAEAEAASLYKRHGAAVQEVFAPVAHFVDLSKSDESILASLSDLLNTAPRSRAPKRPMRVLLLGPRGSGRHTQASLLAQKYGLVHVNPSALLRGELVKTPSLSSVLAAAEGGLLVPDDVLCPLVVARLLAPDAKQRGFVLDGFPRTATQARALAKASIVPNRVVVLATSEEECLKRVSGRRRDPQTGDQYNFQTPAEEQALPSSVRERLQHAAHDRSTEMEAINFTYASYVDEVKAAYSKVLREIRAPPASNPTEATKSKTAVLEQIEDFLLAPLHNQYAHAKAKASSSSAASQDEKQEE